MLKGRYGVDYDWGYGTRMRPETRVRVLRELLYKVKAIADKMPQHERRSVESEFSIAIYPFSQRVVEEAKQALEDLAMLSEENERLRAELDGAKRCDRSEKC